MNLKVSINQVCYFFLWLSLGYYLGFVSFLGNLSKGGYQGGFESAVSGNLLNQVVGLMLLGLILFFALVTKRIKPSLFLKNQLPWILILSYFLISISWSDVQFISVRRFIAFISLVLTAYVLTTLFDNKTLVKLISNLIVATVVFGLIYSIVKGAPLSFGLGDRGAAFKGIFTDKNGAARVYSYGIMFFIALKRYKTLPELFMLGLLALALLLAQSASAIVITAIGVSLIISLHIFKGSDAHQSFIRTFALSVLVILAVFAISVLYEFLLAALGRDPNLTNRAIIWQLITPLIEAKSTFGYGFGAFWASDAVTGFIERWGFIGNAHSGYFEILLHGGYVGMFLLIFVLYAFFSKAMSNYINNINREIAIIAITILLVQVVINYVGYVIMNHNSVDMFIFCILYFASMNSDQSSKTPLTTVSRNISYEKGI